jgi:aminocarboxymuconate-semialdehyde decarboxylase
VRPEGAAAIPKRPREYARLLHFASLTHSPANLRFLVTELGADRVAMGSDYPFDMGSDDPVASVGLAGLDARALALVEGGTAARFLGL